jgi:hypothetical protein
LTLGGYLPTPLSPQQEEGETGDDNDKDEGEGEGELQATMSSVFQLAALTLMKDVRPDLSSLPALLAPFQTFRTQHPDKYKEAFVSLSLSQVLEQYVLLDIVPLHLLNSQETHKVVVIGGGYLFLYLFFVAFSQYKHRAC